MKNYKSIGEPLCPPSSMESIGAVTMDVKLAFYEKGEGTTNLHGFSTETFDVNCWETNMFSQLAKLLITDFGADKDIVVEALNNTISSLK